MFEKQAKGIKYDDVNVGAKEGMRRKEESVLFSALIKKDKSKIHNGK